MTFRGKLTFRPKTAASSQLNLLARLPASGHCMPCGGRRSFYASIEHVLDADFTPQVLCLDRVSPLRPAINNLDNDDLVALNTVIGFGEFQTAEVFLEPLRHRKEGRES